MADAAIRTLPLTGAFGGTAAVHLAAARPASRLSLRAGSDAIAALSAVLGFALPSASRTSAITGSRFALWLGPDEWLVIDEDGADLMSIAGSAEAIHSATDVSHRNTAILVSGPGAVDTLNGGCPLDLTLEAFPVGSCARTLLGKIEVVLLRLAEDSFRVECWRSFSDYAFGLLQQSATDI